jgi:hypothetical protein
MVHFPNSEGFDVDGDLRRADVWLDQRAWETIFHLKERHGASISHTVRVALEALRRQLRLDEQAAGDPIPVEWFHL